MKALTLLLTLSILLLGCLGEQETIEETTTTTLAEEADYALEEVDIPQIQENSTVEIGEMI